MHVFYIDTLFPVKKKRTCSFPSPFFNIRISLVCFQDAAEINSTIFALKECFRVMRSSKGQCCVWFTGEVRRSSSGFCDQVNRPIGRACWPECSLIASAATKPWWWPLELSVHLRRIRSIRSEAWLGKGWRQSMWDTHFGPKIWPPQFWGLTNQKRKKKIQEWIRSETPILGLGELPLCV